MTFPIRPILGRIIIKIETSGEKVSEAGVIVALDSARGKAKREGTDRVGVVVAMDEAFYLSDRNVAHQERGNEDGPGAWITKKSMPDVNVGERVFFSVSWAGESFERDGETYHVLEGEDAALLLSEDVVVEALSR